MNRIQYDSGKWPVFLFPAKTLRCCFTQHDAWPLLALNLATNKMWVLLYLHCWVDFYEVKSFEFIICYVNAIVDKLKEKKFFFLKYSFIIHWTKDTN